MRSRSRLSALMAVSAMALTVSVSTGCARTYQTRSVAPSGFLADYSELAPGKGGEALLFYINPRADFSTYTRVLVDPVTIWHGSGLEGVPEEELQNLANHLEGALREHLALDFELAERPGPDTLRIRIAITEAKASPAVLNFTSAILPPARLLSEAKRLATGTHAFVGKAAIEGEVLDGLTDERLVAAVDERAGGKRLGPSSSSWGDVEAAFDEWADGLRARLSALRQFDAAHTAQDAEAEPEG